MTPSPAGLPPRWIGVGTSADPDAATAGRAAASEALTGSDPKLVIVFCSAMYDEQVLLDAINEVTGGVSLIGCSTAGEIAGSRTATSSVVVTVLGGDGFTVETASAVLDDHGPRAAGVALASCGDINERSEHRILMLLIDGLAANQEDILRGAYSVLGASVPLVGGAAGDDKIMGTTAQLHGNKVLHGAAVGAVIDSDAPFGIGVQHGWHQVGEAMMVTRSVNGRVYTLDDKPALDAYLDRLSAPPETYHDAVAFQIFAMTRPLSVRRRGGEEVRGVNTQPDFQDRSLASGGEIPQGGLTWVMEGDAASVLEATDVACSDALAALGDRPPIGFLAFDCVARFETLGAGGLLEEIRRIGEHTGDVPVAGFYTYGEIARVRGINGFHHQTLVMLAIA